MVTLPKGLILISFLCLFDSIHSQTSVNNQYKILLYSLNNHKIQDLDSSKTKLAVYKIKSQFPAKLQFNRNVGSETNIEDRVVFTENGHRIDRVPVESSTRENAVSRYKYRVEVLDFYTNDALTTIKFATSKLKNSLAFQRIIQRKLNKL